MTEVELKTLLITYSFSTPREKWGVAVNTLIRIGFNMKAVLEEVMEVIEKHGKRFLEGGSNEIDD